MKWYASAAGLGGWW